jgi:hypothetical protein
MVSNNPETFADLDGHWDWCQQVWNEVKGNGYREA